MLPVVQGVVSFLLNCEALEVRAPGCRVPPPDFPPLGLCRGARLSMLEIFGRHAFVNWVHLMERLCSALVFGAAGFKTYSMFCRKHAMRRQTMGDATGI